MYGKSFNSDLPTTKCVTRDSTRRSKVTAVSINRVPASRRKSGETESATNRKQGVKGHLKADDLAATGKSLHVPVYKPIQAAARYIETLSQSNSIKYKLTCTLTEWRSKASCCICSSDNCSVMFLTLINS